MIDFLIKSTLCLCALLAVYHLALEKEKMHQFNRFYLLFSLVFSLAIPFITIEIVLEITNPALPKNIIKAEGATMVFAEDSTDYALISIWSLYVLVTSLLLIRFIRNILKLTSKTKSNTAIDYKNSKLVLLKEETLPYTFLNTIFINETDYHNRKIEAELFTHELIHVTQRHTLDILLIETLKALFWFNPIFIFYKKAIQLNHEFLADEKVVKSHNNVPFYQNLLLSKANANPSYYLASNLNYSVTKKRLIMMTRTTSASRAILKKTVLIPILSGLIFFACVKTVAQEKRIASVKESKNQITGMEKYFKNTNFKIQDKRGNTVAEKKFRELSSEEKKNVPPPPPPTTKQTTRQQLEDLKNPTGPREVALTVYKTPDTIKTKPTFPGGMDKFYNFVAKNFKISKEATDNKIKGKVYVTFMVEKDGSLTDFNILRDTGYGTGEETVRVLKLCPKWSPGTIDGKAARVLYSLPITIQTAE